jgi:hypothetical protein
MLRAFDNLDRAYKGYDTSLALLAVIRSLSYLPGCKTIVLFSEGLPVSPVLSTRFDALIEAANRANVTAYAVDAKGLRTRSDLSAARKEVDTFAEERLTQIASGSNRTEQPLSMGFERVEDTLKLDSRTGSRDSPRKPAVSSASSRTISCPPSAASTRTTSSTTC